MQPGNKHKWSIEKIHSSIGFLVKHLIVSHVRGEFKEFVADVFMTGDDIRNVDINVWINSASISTGDAARDARLKGAAFFDVKNFKTINFTGKELTNIRDDMYTLNGELTMKGIARNISLNVEYGGMIKSPQSERRANFLVTGKINRKEWGLTWNELIEMGDVIVAEEVLVHCEIELVRQSEQSL